MMKTALATLVFLGAAVQAHAIENPAFCVADDGATISRYLAFVIDWQHAPVSGLVATEVAQATLPGVTPLIDDVLVSQVDDVFAPPALRVAPVPVVRRSNQVIRPSIDMEASAVQPERQPRRVIDFSDVWFIGGYR